MSGRLIAIIGGAIVAAVIGLIVLGAATRDSKDRVSSAEAISIGSVLYEAIAVNDADTVRTQCAKLAGIDDDADHDLLADPCNSFNVQHDVGTARKQIADVLPVIAVNAASTQVTQRGIADATNAARYMTVTAELTPSP